MIYQSREEEMEMKSAMDPIEKKIQNFRYTPIPEEDMDTALYYHVKQQACKNRYEDGHRDSIFETLHWILWEHEDHNGFIKSAIYMFGKDDVLPIRYRLEEYRRLQISYMRRNIERYSQNHSIFDVWWFCLEVPKTQDKDLFLEMLYRQLHLNLIDEDIEKFRSILKSSIKIPPQKDENGAKEGAGEGDNEPNFLPSTSRQPQLQPLYNKIKGKIKIILKWLRKIF